MGADTEPGPSPGFLFPFEYAVLMNLREESEDKNIATAAIEIDKGMRRNFQYPDRQFYSRLELAAGTAWAAFLLTLRFPCSRCSLRSRVSHGTDHGSAVHIALPQEALQRWVPAHPQGREWRTSSLGRTGWPTQDTSEMLEVIM